MKIGLYNLEPKYKNLALEKLRIYHRESGDIVSDCTPIEAWQYDRIYCSSIFDYSEKDYITPAMITGGTGFDEYNEKQPTLSVVTKLPDEIEAIKPHLNFGFTTRGCFRCCPFCVAWIKEGKRVYETGDLYSLWDGFSHEVVLMDNNSLAIPEHFIMVNRQAQENNIILDYNQGLDIRLIDERTARVMANTNMRRIRFAFDHPDLEEIIREKVAMLRTISKFERRDFSFYVLMGFEGTIDDDLHRLQVLKELGCRAYGMKHKNLSKKDRRRQEVVRWANLPWAFMKYTFDEFFNLRMSGAIG